MATEELGPNAGQSLLTPDCLFYLDDRKPQYHHYLLTIL